MAIIFNNQPQSVDSVMLDRINKAEVSKASKS